MTRTIVNKRKCKSVFCDRGQLVEDFKEIDNAEGCETGKTTTF